jgi:3-keto-disaccharide hydrolase
MRRLRISSAAIVAFLWAAVPAMGKHIDVPPHGKAVVLFDGHDLSHFDIFLRDHGLNEDPEHVFQVEKGVVHVSGKGFGYFITKDEYTNFYLRAEFKWGEGTFLSKAGKARDSGILYCIQGPQKVWPRSVEFQIQEGATGDFWMTDGGAITGKDGVRVTGPPGKALRIDRFGKGPWKDVTGYRDPNGDAEKAHGKWNVVELVVQNGTAKQYVNGKLVNEGTDAFPASGKVLFQSEGSEIYFRNIKLYPLK